MIAQILSSIGNNFKSWVTKFIFECFLIKKSLIEDDHIFFRIWDAGFNKQQLPGSSDRKTAGERGRKHVGSNVRTLAGSRCCMVGLCDRKTAGERGRKHVGSNVRKLAGSRCRIVGLCDRKTAGERGRTIGRRSRTVGRNDFWVTQPWSGNLRKSFFHFFIIIQLLEII